MFDGLAVGVLDGRLVIVGLADGLVDGLADGLADGLNVGIAVGFAVGLTDFHPGEE